MSPNRVFVSEPVAAKSRFFVDTHEYVAPEVASGRSHGNSVDWWTFGIFTYEMIYGQTPFSAPSNETTLRGIVKKPLVFPTHAPSSTLKGHARDLISSLLNKDPELRLGSKRGAADVKKHAFFKGLNYALVRTMTPPAISGVKTVALYPRKSSKKFMALDYFRSEEEAGSDNIRATC